MNQEQTQSEYERQLKQWDADNLRGKWKWRIGFAFQLCEIAALFYLVFVK